MNTLVDGRKLFALRKKRGWTREELAQTANQAAIESKKKWKTSMGALQSIEQSPAKFVRDSTINVLALAFSVDRDALIALIKSDVERPADLTKLEKSLLKIRDQIESSRIPYSVIKNLLSELSKAASKSKRAKDKDKDAER